jgi:hypothetical protein
METQNAVTGLGSVLGDFGEPIHNTYDAVKQLRQTWNDQLVWPLTELPERYLRGRPSVLLNLRCQCNEQVNNGQACVSQMRRNDFEGEFHDTRRVADDERMVFIGDVHFV